MLMELLMENIGIWVGGTINMCQLQDCWQGKGLKWGKAFNHISSVLVLTKNKELIYKINSKLLTLLKSMREKIWVSIIFSLLFYVFHYFIVKTMINSLNKINYIRAHPATAYNGPSFHNAFYLTILYIWF